MSTVSDSLAQELEQTLFLGSRSFYWASRLLPRGLRTQVAVVYAFCRTADDLVDEGPSPEEGLEELKRRTAAIVEGRPDSGPADQAMSQLIQAEPELAPCVQALVEGMAWDVEGRRYRSEGDLLDYCARAASSVGLLLTRLWGRRSPTTLQRAGELGLAMQLTNVARDVMEDAARGRIYLPESWLGASREAVLADLGAHRRALQAARRRCLGLAEQYYQSAEAGIPDLPRAVRPAVRAARLIYASIGNEIESWTDERLEERAVVGPVRKLWCTLRALFPLRGERASTPALPAETGSTRALAFLMPTNPA